MEPTSKLRTILIVDDERQVRTVISRYLVRNGYTCFEASGVDEALEMLAGPLPIGIVVTDIKMPGKTGVDLLAHVTAMGDERPRVIVMTGFGGDVDADVALRLGAHDFITKPIDFDYLLKSLHCIDGTPSEHA